MVTLEFIWQKFHHSSSLWLFKVAFYDEERKNASGKEEIRRNSRMLMRWIIVAKRVSTMWHRRSMHFPSVNNSDWIYKDIFHTITAIVKVTKLMDDLILISRSQPLSLLKSIFLSIIWTSRNARILLGATTRLLAHTYKENSRDFIPCTCSSPLLYAIVRASTREILIHGCLLFLEKQWTAGWHAVKSSVLLSRNLDKF